MSESQQPHRPDEPGGAAEPAAPTEPAPVAPPVAGSGTPAPSTVDPAPDPARTPFDAAPAGGAADEPGRLRRMRSLIAVGLAGVIVGGLGGTTVTALVTHDDGPSHSSNVEGGFRGGPGPMPRPEGRP